MNLRMPFFKAYFEKKPAVTDLNLKLAGVFFILLAFLTIYNSAAAHGQNTRISLEIQNKTLEEALFLVQEATGYSINYVDVNPGALSVTKRVNLSADNDNYRNVLREILGDFGLTFTQRGNNIIIQPQQNRGSGVLQGTVTDSETGEPLIGATIYIPEVEQGGATNISGDYRLDNVPAGTYNVIFRYVGYESIQKPGIEVNANKTTRLDAQLKPQDLVIGEVVITGQIDKREAEVVETNEVDLIEEVRASDLNITGISREQITRSLDFDAAEVVQRAPAVTIVDEFINIRGLNERYNLVYLNDMIAPSSEADKRAFSFEMLPSGVIDKIVIYRTAAPELPGDFAGGVVKIHTRNTSRARQLQVGFSSQYREGSSFEDVYGYQGGDYDWLGFDDGTRDLPDIFPSREELPFAPVFPLFGTLTEPQRQAQAENAGAGKILARNSNWSIMPDEFALDYRANLNYYDSWEVGSVQINNLTAGFYHQENEAYEREVQFRPRDLGIGNYFLDSVSQTTARLGAMQNWSFRLNENHSFYFNNLFNNLGENRTSIRTGNESADTGLGGGRSDTLTDVQLFWQERLLYTGQIGGDHTFYAKDSVKHTLGWGGGYSYMREDIPNQRQFRVGRRANNPFPDGQNRLLIVAEVGVEGFAFNLQNFQDTEERTFSYFADYVAAWPSGIEVKAGTFLEFKARDFDNRFITLRPGGMYDQNNLPLNPTGPNREFVVSDIFTPDAFRIDGTGLILREEIQAGSSYSATNDHYAGYAGIKVPFFDKKLSVYAGARYEWNQLLLNTNLGTDDTTNVDLFNRFLLPSVNATYNINEKMLLRGAYGWTINRPQFRELSEFIYFDFDLNANIRGNSDLVVAEIENVDLRWEYYPGPGEWVTFGAFYKFFRNPIEGISNTIETSPREFIRYQNSESAWAFGLEGEVRKSLYFLGEGLRHFSVILNAAWLENEVDINEDEVRGEPGPLLQGTRPLQGTSNYVINGSLYYDNTLSGWSGNFQYNVFGQRLFLAANLLTSDVYELPRHLVDINIQKRFGRSLVIQAGVKNLFDEPIRFYKDYIRDGEYDPDEVAPGTGIGFESSDYYTIKYNVGRYYSLGVQYIMR